MNHIVDRLVQKSHIKQSLIVVGLDPKIENFPDFLIKGKSLENCCEAILSFNNIVIDAVQEHAIAVKPQLAYYEVFGSKGIKALEQTIKYAYSKNLIVINDAKRNDVGSTSESYAKAFLGDGPMAGDMVTVNPYLGSDSYQPFINEAKENHKGIFLLLKTSNPSSGEFQNLKLADGEMVYQRFAKKIYTICQPSKGKFGFSNIGAVVGATYQKEAEMLRRMLPATMFLMPGFGHQGGKVKSIKSLLNRNGDGVICSSSRGIIYSFMNKVDNWKKLDKVKIKEIIEESVVGMKEEINKYRV